jgi:hypothetical protein
VAVAEVRIDARQVARMARGIRGIAPEAWRAARVRLRAVGEVVAEDARQRASYSTRIPAEIKATSTAAGNVRISVTGEPSVAIENAGKGFVRHPTYGHRDRFTSKNSHPAFLLPAYAGKQEWALSEMEKAYWDAFDAAWARGG